MEGLERLESDQTPILISLKIIMFKSELCYECPARFQTEFSLLFVQIEGTNFFKKGQSLISIQFDSIVQVLNG